MHTSVRSRVRALLRPNAADIEYRIGDFTILLPEGHQLPAYQRAHKRYDRVLPELVKQIEPGATVIDVGANCGDSLAAMYSANPSLHYLCIEPDDTFFPYLTGNTDRIRRQSPRASIVTIKKMVGHTITSAGLVTGTQDGTRTMTRDPAAKQIRTETLDSIVSGSRNVRLIKSDVDGFDYEIINSAPETIEAHSPMLFFECQIDDASQKAGYELLFRSLRARGYSFVVYDNFGGLIARTSDLAIVAQLLGYLWSQNIGETTRTVHYYDILATGLHTPSNRPGLS